MIQIGYNQFTLEGVKFILNCEWPDLSEIYLSIDLIK